MKHLVAKAGWLAVVGLFAAQTLSAQYSTQQPGQTQPSQTQAGGEAAPAQPAVSKEELDAYNKVYEASQSDPANLVPIAEEFVRQYPDSQFASGVYGFLTSAYFNAGDVEKMLAAGEKALELNPDNVDVLPMMAMAVPRRVNSRMPDAQKRLSDAERWAKHGLMLLSSMPKPEGMTDEAFTRLKNDRMSLCRSGLGIVYFNRGQYQEASRELTQAVALAAEPDPVDYYVLGRADDMLNHFTAAIASFEVCAKQGPLQAQCRQAIENTKQKSQNTLEVPKS